LRFFHSALCAWRAAGELFSAASPLPTARETLCAFFSFSCADLPPFTASRAAMAATESSEDELPLAQLRIVRPAGRGATDLTLPLCARVALVKVKLEHELGVPEADQRLIYGGKVLTDAQTLGDIVQNKEGRQTFHLVVPPPPPAPAPPPVDLDASPEAPAPAPATPPRPAAVMPATPPRQPQTTPITVSPAARAYAEALRNSGFGASPRDATRQFVEDARRALAASQPPAQQQPEPQPHLWDHIRDNEFLDWTLMLKLLAGVALLGQDASRGRVAGLIGAATAAYAVQTGLAYALWELFSSTRPRRRSHQGYRVRSAGEIVRASFDGTIHGPRDGGRLADFGLLVASLVLSLAPPWRPRDRADVLLLRVRDSLSSQIVWFKVKTTTKFGKVYRAFAARQAGDGPQRAWIFSLPGSTDVISEDATPLDLGLTPESILEARPAGPTPAAEPAAAPAEPVAA
jgi:hypothetical protein